jgi:hypothetical protein
MAGSHARVGLEKKKKKQGMIGGGVGAQLAIGGVALGCVIVEIEDDTVTEWSPSTLCVCVCWVGRRPGGGCGGVITDMCNAYATDNREPCLRLPLTKSTRDSEALSRCSSAHLLCP